jgi:hypothetical protein
VIDEVAEPTELDVLRSAMHDIWGPDVVVPRNLLRGHGARRRVPAGGPSRRPATHGDHPVGFALGFLGWEGGVHLHSHQVGVIHELRSAGVGYALKLAQRAQALRHGVTEMRWTYDPMLFANARFNLVRLGARPVGVLPALLRRPSRRVQHRRPHRPARGELAARHARRAMRPPSRPTTTHSSSCPPTSTRCAMPNPLGPPSGVSRSRTRCSTHSPPIVP